MLATYSSVELDKLKTTTVEFDDVLGFRRRRLLVCLWGFYDASGMLTLAVLATPDEIGLASTSA